MTSIASADQDLADCAREPIRVPGSIQPHGCLFAVDPSDLSILQSAVGDADPLVTAPTQGADLRSVLVPEAGELLAGLDRLSGGDVQQLGIVRGRERQHHLLAHRSADGNLIVELERSSAMVASTFDDIFPNVRGFLEGLSRCSSIEELATLAAREVRAITGLDRALVYQFDEDWNGAVIAEDGNDRLPSYLDLRFPASDIPAQARELYRLNRLRLIADANYRPQPITPELSPRTSKPLDLSFSVLRSVSPVHLEYMRNMGTMASMSISLLRDGELWGLISCHHKDPALVGYPVRTACDFIGRILSLQIDALESASYSSRRSALQDIQAGLLARMAASAAGPAGRFTEGLLEGREDLLSLTRAAGAALVMGDEVHLIGSTPSKTDVRAIVDWLLEGSRDDVFVTDQLSSVMAGAERLKDTASGLLAISVSQIHDSYVLWFKPEVLQTVTWGGDPRKRAEMEPSGMRLHPRTSFEAWQETVRLRSTQWERAEVEAASGLRTAIVDIVLRQAEEMAAISDKLAASNRELEAFSYSVSHDLRAPFRHIVGYAELLKKFEGEKISERGERYIETIIESAISAGTLVDDLLSFSQMGRNSLVAVGIDLNDLVKEVRAGLRHEERGRKVEWRVADLPQVQADPMMLKLAVQNLLENALKFTRGRDTAVIEVIGETEGNMAQVSVRDNGAGFDMAYVGKLFGVFQRLHRVEEFEGTGIGLANVKRIMERHGGSIWAEGRIDEGATFTFTLPLRRA